MKTAHRIIRYLAIALAVAILAGICAAIVSVFNGFSIGVGFSGSDVSSEKIFSGNEESILYVEIAASKVRISEGSALEGVSDNDYITVEVRGNKLVAIEQKHSAIKDNETYLNITVPEDLVFDRIVIKTGAGVVNASALKAEELELELGAGEVIIDFIEVYDEASIEGGAGKITIDSGTINNLDAELGVGEANIRACLTGENDIETGVGELNLTLLGGKDSYKVKASTGLGGFKIDGEKLSDNKTFGNGSSVISVDGGIGSIDIKFE